MAHARLVVGVPRFELVLSHAYVFFDGRVSGDGGFVDDLHFPFSGQSALLQQLHGGVGVFLGEGRRCVLLCVQPCCAYSCILA